jgi:hypothetical protein
LFCRCFETDLLLISAAYVHLRVPVFCVFRVKCEEPSPSFTLSDPVDYPFGGTAQVKSESSQAITIFGTSSIGELAIVPAPRSKQRDFGQRRKRRPFSIPETVSLVEAVEKLGFGRFVSIMTLPIAPRSPQTTFCLRWASLSVCPGGRT